MRDPIAILALCATVGFTNSACNTAEQDCSNGYSGDPCQKITEQIQGLYLASGNCGTINVMVVASDSLVNGFRIFLGGISSQTSIWAEFTSETEFDFPVQNIQGGSIVGGGNITTEGLTYHYSASTGGGGFDCTFNATPTNGGMQNNDLFRAMINGEVWEADLAIDSYISGTDYTDLIGVSTDGTMVDILINGEVTVGTYVAAEGAADAQISLRTGFSGGEQYYSTGLPGYTGQIVISSVSSTRITGTFSGTVATGTAPTSIKIITSGSFEVTL